MPVLPFMENLLAVEAEAKYLLAAGDRSHEQKLMQELLRIFKEAELVFGPRDTSYQLSGHLCVLCVSVVDEFRVKLHHRGRRGCTEKSAIETLCLLVSERLQRVDSRCASRW
jgi:hypothetical protein